MPEGVAEGLALADGDVVEEADGLSGADGDRDGDGLTADVAVQPASMMPIAASVVNPVSRPRRGPLDTHIRRGRRSRHARPGGWRPWGRGSANCSSARSPFRDGR